MRRAIYITLGAFSVVLLLGGGAALIIQQRAPSVTPVAVITTATPITPTSTVTPTSTLIYTVTSSATPTLTSTYTPTLSTLVLHITAINPDVTLDAPLSTPRSTVTPSPQPTLLVPTPAGIIAFAPTGTSAPGMGWVRFPADAVAIQRTGQWETFTQTYRSASRRYLYTNAPNAALSLRFVGAAVRVRFARLSSYGVFEVRIDGRVVTTVDAYLPKTTLAGDFVTTDVFALAHGWHTLDIRRLDRRNPNSTDNYIAIDAVDVYQNGTAPTAAPAATLAVPTLTPSPAPVQKIQLLVAPPTIPPTPTLAPPKVTAVALTIAYDLNGNKAVEPGEGVSDLPVQLVTADTNRIVAASITDAQGYVRVEATGTAPLRLVVPYLNRFWDITARNTETRITLILPPANRPALIP